MSMLTAKQVNKIMAKIASTYLVLENIIFRILKIKEKVLTKNSEKIELFGENLEKNEVLNAFHLHKNKINS